MDTTVISMESSLSFKARAASSPARSSGFMMEGTPSRTRVPVFLSTVISVESGTCLINTAIFIFSRFLSNYRSMAPEITIRCTSEVPS